MDTKEAGGTRSDRGVHVAILAPITKGDPHRRSSAWHPASIQNPKRGHTPLPPLLPPPGVVVAFCRHG